MSALGLYLNTTSSLAGAMKQPAWHYQLVYQNAPHTFGPALEPGDGGGSVRVNS